MSGTAETEMQIQIVIHGEAFCPSMMTTETPFANRKLLLEEITNNERNGIEEEQMEEIEIKEGHDDVEEEQGNKAKENPFVNQKLLLEEITNNERNDMEEGQMEENEIKEGHEDVEEEQDNEIKLPINNNVTRSAWSASETTIILHPVQHYDKAVKMLKVKAMQEELRQLWFAVFAQFAQKEINKMQLEEQKNPWQKENEDSHFDLELDPLNRKLWLEEIINNERKAMEVRQMEKNEIKEGHEDVGEKQNNKAEETPIANRKLLLQKITNNKRNEMEEEPLEEIEIKEGHEDVEEEQDNMKMKLFRIMVIVNNIKERQEEVQEEQDEEVTWEHLELSFLSLEASLKGFEGGPGYSILEKCLTNRWNPFDEKMKISRFLFRGGQSRRKLFFRKGRNKREQWESEKERKYLGIWGGGGKRAICADCHLESRPGQAFNPFELHAECRPKCPFVVNVKKRNAGQTNDVATQTFPVCKPGEDIFKRNAITQHAAPQQSGKLIDIIEDYGGFDVTEKGGGNRTVYADCHLEYRPDQADNLIELHAALRPKCPFVENVKKWNAGQTNDVATQTVPVREQGEDIFRGNAITQHAAPQQSGKLIDITEDQCEFDDTEKEIQEMDELLRCKVCLDSDACIVFLPCRHMATCEYCEGFLNHCPVCRSFIEEAVKINEE